MTRSDSWKPEEEQLLITTVLECVRSGDTQLKAFEYVGQKVNRTPAACGFHWNSTLRKQNEEALTKAKQEGRSIRKNKKGAAPAAPATLTSHVVPQEFPIEELLNSLSEAFRSLQADNDRLRREVFRLEKELDNVPKSEDFKDLLKLLAKAKQSGLVDKESPAS